MKKQVAMKQFRGGNGTFSQGLRELRSAVESADQALRAAERYLPAPKPASECDDPTRRTHEDRAEERRWIAALMEQAWQTGITICSCRVTFGRCDYRTGSGLEFYWDRWDSDPGYTFGVIHPKGSFPDDSSLRPALEQAGWQINTYSEKGKFLRTEEPLVFIDNHRIEVVAVEEDKMWETFAAHRDGKGVLLWGEKCFSPEGKRQKEGESLQGYQAFDPTDIPLVLERLLRRKELMEKDRQVLSRFFQETVQGLALNRAGQMLVSIDDRQMVVYGNRDDFRVVGLWAESKSDGEPWGGRFTDEAHLASHIDRLSRAVETAKGEVGFDTLFGLAEVFGILPAYPAGEYQQRYYLAIRGQVYRVYQPTCRDEGDYQLRWDRVKFQQVAGSITWEA